MIALALARPSPGLASEALHAVVWAAAQATRAVRGRRSAATMSFSSCCCLHNPAHLAACHLGSHLPRPLPHARVSPPPGGAMHGRPASAPMRSARSDRATRPRHTHLFCRWLAGQHHTAATLPQPLAPHTRAAYGLQRVARPRARAERPSCFRGLGSDAPWPPPRGHASGLWCPLLLRLLCLLPLYAVCTPLPQGLVLTAQPTKLAHADDRNNRARIKPIQAAS